MSKSILNTLSPPVARRWVIGGRVQGVGFRPFICRLARHHGLHGQVRNLGGIVEIVAGGDDVALTEFAVALFAEAPNPAAPRLIACHDALPPPAGGFSIVASADGIPGKDPLPAGTLLPDQSLCAECRAEIDDPRRRRHRYPFTNCARCGPRYSIVTALPFDRAHTTLAGFPPCPTCAAEYVDPEDRRFHAQTLVCPACGPRLHYRDVHGRAGHEGQRHAVTALARTVEDLRAGAIIAIKGIGGWHLCCDARNHATIARLRNHKSRPDKPLAVMFPDGESFPALDVCISLDDTHRAALADPTCPILIAPRAAGCPLPENLAPGLDEIGILLPYAPLHYLLLQDLAAPLVVTSANPRGEPVLTDRECVETRLTGIFDSCLDHDRPIRRPAEDPLRRVIAGRARSLRPGRGDAPLEMPLAPPLDEPLLAVGGHTKNTVALAVGDRVLVAPEIAGLDTPRGWSRFTQTLEDLQALHGVRARRVACDLHPGYASRRWALASGLPVLEVAHHEAHAAIVAGECPQPGPWLVFTWDGIGLGSDGTLWGGEALLGRAGAWQRVAGFRPFRVPGAEGAGREPWRSAVALCLETGLPPDPAMVACASDPALFVAAWRRDHHCTTIRSVGRLFDAAAALILGECITSHEAQGPMRLEAAAMRAMADTGDLPVTPALPLTSDAAGVLEADWQPLLALMRDRACPPATRALAFHAALAETLLAQARALRARHGPFTVGLSGGVFQNRLLTERVIALLETDGFEVRLPTRIPYNDAGLSYGQIAEVAARESRP